LTLQKEQQRLLTQAVAELPMPFRTVLILSEIEELPHREIAALLGCRVGTVKSRLFRARQRLREDLEPYWTGTSQPVAAGETS
jgi:RNA polymerase sigma-70 factor (ECF subfamily)